MVKSSRSGDDGKARKYWYNREREEAAAALVGELLTLRMTDVDIWIIGTWVWATGDTKPHRAGLKALKMRWHSKRVCWYWSPPGYRSRYNSRASLADLADTYGARQFAHDQRETEASSDDDNRKVAVA